MASSAAPAPGASARPHPRTAFPPKDQEEHTTGTAPDDELQVTLDLLAEDAKLRETIREPMTVRLTTGAVITVPHSADWPVSASRLAAVGAWDAWASGVLAEDDQKAFREADLRDYQVKRILEALNAADGITPGKPPRSSSSRRSTPTR